jgi:flagellar export protein FliJ
MKRFSYGLQAVLTLRDREEQRCLERYGMALAACQRAGEELAAVVRLEAETRAHWAEQVRSVCTAGELVRWELCHRKLLERRKAAQTALNQAESNAAKALEQVLHARREHESVQQHRRRQRALYDYAHGRELQNALDELAQRSRSESLLSAMRMMK